MIVYVSSTSDYLFSECVLNFSAQNFDYYFLCDFISSIVEMHSTFEIAQTRFIFRFADGLVL